MLKSQHVQQRDLDHDCIPHLRMLCELYPHQQSTVRSADNSQPARRSDFACHQVLRDSIEVIVNSLAVRLEASFMPCGSELSTASNIGPHSHAAVLQP